VSGALQNAGRNEGTDSLIRDETDFKLKFRVDPSETDARSGVLVVLKSSFGTYWCMYALLVQL
jgi:hypothetical protein